MARYLRQLSDVNIDTYFVPEMYESTGGHLLPYRLYSPCLESDECVPLVLHMHGHGGEGTNNVNHITGDTEKATARIRGNLICIHPENQKRFPCYVIAPQAAEGGWVTFTTEPTDSILAILELVPCLQQRFPIDPERCYVLGHSMGAHGAWDLITRASDLFAAAVPIGGWGLTEWAHRVVGKSIWAFHVDGDPLMKVKYTRNMIAAIRKAGGDPKYTEYEGSTHGENLRAYKEPELLPWLFSQRRK